MTKSKGRPPQSQIRQNVVEILHYLGSAYGYQICKKYMEIFPAATKRVIYYHLHKGIELGEFAIDRIQKETGEYSWGSQVERVYYKLGKNAKPRGDPQVKEAIKSQK